MVTTTARKASRIEGMRPLFDSTRFRGQARKPFRYSEPTAEDRAWWAAESARIEEDQMALDFLANYAADHGPEMDRWNY